MPPDLWSLLKVQIFIGFYITVELLEPEGLAILFIPFGMIFSNMTKYNDPMSLTLAYI